MPQFQLLPQQPGFGQQLGAQLGTGVGLGLTKGLQQQLQQFQEQKKMKQLQEQFEKLGLPQELAGLDPQIAKQFMISQQKKSLMDQLFGPSEEPLHPAETPGIGGVSQPSKEISAKDVEAATLLDPNLGRAKQQERKLQQQEVQEVKKRNLGVFDKASADLKTIEEADQGLTQLQKLSEKIGKTQGQSFFNRLGRTFRFDSRTGGFSKIGKATSTPQEERYIKLIADQTKTIKNDFGARITNLDLQVFLRRFPDLMMTPDGRKAIFETMRDYKEAKKIYNQALKNEIKLTKGKADPYELDEIVEEKIAPRLNKIQERIRHRGFGIQSTQEEREGIEEQTATNPKTGEKMILRGGEWQVL